MLAFDMVVTSSSGTDSSGAEGQWCDINPFIETVSTEFLDIASLADVLGAEPRAWICNASTSTELYHMRAGI